MEIRQGTDAELEQLCSVHRLAFAEEGAVLAALVRDLLGESPSSPVLSLVAEDAGELVGSALFTPVSVAGSTEGEIYILAPLAVLPARQHRGIGAALMARGLEILRERGVGIVLVYGDPNYYNRAGFRAGHKLRAPYELAHPPEAWMAQELSPGALAGAEGVIECLAPLQAPEHW